MGGPPQSEIDERAAELIQRSRLFFVATAPLTRDGHINLSPKGFDSFRVANPKQFAYLDYIGSGTETVAHIRDNGRVTVMFPSFDENPSILRLYGRGTVVFPAHPEFGDWLRHFEGCDLTGVRSVIVVNVERVTKACGFGVPVMSFQGYRSQLPDWKLRKGEDGMLAYQVKHNLKSIDDLEGVPADVLDAQTNAPQQHT